MDPALRAGLWDFLAFGALADCNFRLLKSSDQTAGEGNPRETEN
jgi:hypothetical protein